MSATIVLNLFRSTKRPHLKEETKIKFPYEERSGTCTLGADGIAVSPFGNRDKDQRSIGKRGRLHLKSPEAEHQGLYERLVLNGTLCRHLANVNE